MLKLHGIIDTESDEARLRLGLEAIVARIDGVYDHPALMAFGPLHTDKLLDCALIADCSLVRT